MDQVPEDQIIIIIIIVVIIVNFAMFPSSNLLGLLVCLSIV